jgi:hypothetical protein
MTVLAIVVALAYPPAGLVSLAALCITVLRTRPVKPRGATILAAIALTALALAIVVWVLAIVHGGDGAGSPIPVQRP